MIDIVPDVSHTAYRLAFESKAHSLGLQPSDPWVGGYVQYEWAHLRHLLDALPVAIKGQKVLEVGCNVGASSIVMSKMGADVTAFDISPDLVELAQLNALQHGCRNIAFDCIVDSRALPYATGKFDLVVCNSVLEYIPSSHLQLVASELHRVLAVGGLVLVTGTSNRLWPREIHSGRWGANYLPRLFDALFGTTIQRGLTPWQIKNYFGKSFISLDKASADGFYRRSRKAMGMSDTKLRGIVWLAQLLRTSPGSLTPSISCLLKLVR